MQGARSIVAKEGIGGLYHGLLPTLLRDVPDIAIQFTLYERLRRMLERRRSVSKLRTWEHLILGGFSGTLQTGSLQTALPLLLTKDTTYGASVPSLIGWHSAHSVLTSGQ